MSLIVYIVQNMQNMNVVIYGLILLLTSKPDV